MLETHGCVRFFAPAEVASLHGAVRPVLSPANRRLAMRLFGNAIAVPHAVAALVQSCHTAGIALQLRVEEAVQACLRARLHNGNSLFACLTVLIGYFAPSRKQLLPLASSKHACAALGRCFFDLSSCSRPLSLARFRLHAKLAW